MSLAQYQLVSKAAQAKASAILAQRLAGNLPSRALLEQYRPRPAWFRRPDMLPGLHGINHEARVLIWQELLARLVMQDGLTLDTEALRWAAVTHDTQRVEDDLDLGHGERAALWVRQHMQGTIPASSLETVAYINRWHVPSDRLVPRMTLELAVFKDADALERVRLGGTGLDPRYLRWKQSKQCLLPLANALLLASGRHRRAGAALFDCAMLAARELGLLAAEAGETE